MRWQRRARRWETIHEQPDISRPHPERCVAAVSRAATSFKAQARSVSPLHQLARPSAQIQVTPRQASSVTFWTVATEPELSALQKIVDNFNSENSDVQAKLVQMVGDETDTTKLMTAVRGGIGPDVYMLDRFIVAQRASEGVLQDLQSSWGRRFSEVYIPFAQAEATFQGAPFALPFETDARALFYNIGMLQEAGSIRPSSTLPMVQSPSIRWPSSRTSSIETDEDGNYSRMGFPGITHQAWHYTYGFAFGGTFFDEATCELTPDNEGVVAGHQWLYDYVAALDPQKVNAFAGPYAGTVLRSRGAASVHHGAHGVHDQRRLVARILYRNTRPTWSSA